ncbi:MAG: hypothetical protein JSS35_08610, partial [Proteobacteria bacterium]|nr:hypothetical protein [Pseudomonadota bacterium]
MKLTLRAALIATGLVATTLALAAGPALAAELAYPPLVNGDEPVVVTQHRITGPRGTLAYEARAGRIPIRNAENGEVKGWVFFTAYVVKQP